MPCSVTATSPCITPSSACDVVETAGLDDFDLAYAHEARARALACLGRLDEAAVELKAAHAVIDRRPRGQVDPRRRSRQRTLVRPHPVTSTVTVMSMKVELGELAERIREYSFAYLVTVGDEGRAHLLAVLPELGGESLTIGGVGKHSLANVTTHADGDARVATDEARTATA